MFVCVLMFSIVWVSDCVEIGCTGFKHCWKEWIESLADEWFTGLQINDLDDESITTN